MSLAVFGLLYHADGTEYRPAAKKFDMAFIKRHAQLYDELGFERILIGQNARSPDPLAIVSAVTSFTKKLKFMIAHRPGFIAPTMAARMFATLDQLSGGRCAAHIITGGSDVETQCDGDFLTKEQRYARSGEYVGVLRQIWESAAPVDHNGAQYQFQQGFSDVKPVQKPSIPIYWGGASEAAIQTGAACADVYAMGGGGVEKAASLVSAVRSAAKGRDVKFCMSMRVIIGKTPDAAWENAARYRDAIVTYRDGGGTIGRDKGEASVQAVQEAEKQTDPADPLLWNGITLATKGRTHATALVGSPDQLTDALLKYYRAGISNFILTGFDPIEDTIAIGTELIPRLHRAAAA